MLLAGGAALLLSTIDLSGFSPEVPVAAKWRARKEGATGRFKKLEAKDKHELDMNKLEAKDKHELDINKVSLRNLYDGGTLGEVLGGIRDWHAEEAGITP
ncbi:hypothetical protein T484DRAFT_1860841 [Baffinella frigidus]|nr:hypothetical protein T484DRAFT_1860841 [Cryptophyta sp. CCMP2293]